MSIIPKEALDVWMGKGYDKSIRCSFQNIEMIRKRGAYQCQKFSWM